MYWSFCRDQTLVVPSSRTFPVAAEIQVYSITYLSFSFCYPAYLGGFKKPLKAQQCDGFIDSTSGADCVSALW